ncbi:MAG TPA: phosphodiesterase, partial [Gammaproteobacteria bacterium]|nr:phosphodiesterase [Gammaproteobacteria bacterium]
EPAQVPETWAQKIQDCLSQKEALEFDDSQAEETYYWFLFPAADNTYVNCYARNISKERKSEQGLRQAGQVFDNSIEAIMITDEHASIIRVNPAFRVITGYSEADVIGKTPSFIESEKNTPAFYNDLLKGLDEEGRWQGEVSNRRQNGELYPAYMTISVVKDNTQKITNYISIFSDISERKKAQIHIQQLAYYDSLTRLPNRLHMQKKLHALITHCDVSQQTLSLLYLNLDRFKTINESLGHVAADKALNITANRLVKSVPDTAIVGRMGGDEFLIIVNNKKIENEQEQLIKAIKLAISEPLKLNNQDIYLSCTIGVSHFPGDARNMDDLVKYAETATTRAKQNGSGFELYSSELEIYTEKRINLESRLRKALERDEFLLHYQPQFDLGSGKLVGVEALLRWQDPENGLVSPIAFIPLLEQTGLIKQVGDWVLHQACTQSMTWQKLGIEIPRVAINLSAKQFSQKNLGRIITNIIEDTGINPAFVELEVTESTIMHQLDQVISILSHLHDKGIHISIDDFGTGYSSLSYLKHFPIDVLKIDRSFVSEIPNNKADIAIANTIISLSHNLDLKVIAEGVETREQLKCLREMGCDWAQGYHLSKPLPADQCLDFFEKNAEKKQAF